MADARDIYVAMAKRNGGVWVPPLPAHTTWQGAALEMAPLPAYMQAHYEVVNIGLIEDEE